MGLYDRLEPTTTATTACGPSPTASPSRCSGPSTPCYPAHGYVVRRRDLDQFVAERRRGRGRRARARAPRRVAPTPARRAAGAARSSRTRRSGEEREIHARYVVDRRRGELPVRARPRQQRATAPTRRAWPSAATTRARSTPTRGSRARSTCATATANSLPGLRLDLPGGRRHHQRRHRAALDVPRLARASTPSHLMTEWAATAPEHWGIDPDAILGAAHRRPPPDGRVDQPQGRAHLGGRRRRRRLGQPVQRRGHRLRLRDGPHGRRAPRRGADAPATAWPSQRYPELLEEEYGLYFKVARLFVKRDRPTRR